MWRGLLTHLFFTPLRHQISSWVPSKSLTKPLAVSMNGHGSKPLAIFPSRQNKHPGFQSSACWEAFPSPCPAGCPWVCWSTRPAHGSLSTGPHSGIPNELPLAVTTRQSSRTRARILQICTENSHALTQTLGCFLSSTLVVPRQRPCLLTAFTLVHHGMLCKSGRDKVPP